MSESNLGVGKYTGRITGYDEENRPIVVVTNGKCSLSPGDVIVVNIAESPPLSTLVRHDMGGSY